jgi:formylglycine-generating enzyme required for sulfatase activity
LKGQPPSALQDRRPQTYVTWEGAVKFAAWLSGKTGKEYRLLTETEWEYAARAGTTTAYAFGDTITERQARFSDGSVWSNVFDDRSVEVGSFPPNAWGLHDMHGNVEEWCADGGSIGSDTEVRSLRGGGWGRPADEARSAYRYSDSPASGTKFRGFRVARTL